MSKHRLSFLKYIISLVICVLFACSFFSVSAMTQFSQHSDVPYDNYTYWETDGNFKAVYTKPLFDLSEVLTSYSLDIDDFTELVDISVSKDGYVFILDSNSRIIVLTPDYKLYKEIRTVGNMEFKGAKGIFATDDSV